MDELTAKLDELVLAARKRRGLHRAIAMLRIFVGFAFVPSGLKKVLAQPFTDPHLHGPFHDFLHAFHATGAFYQFVGVVQLVTATLLVTQRLATAGALLALPIFSSIAVLCWSTKVYPTAAVVTLLWLSTLALLVWDWPTWRAVLGRNASHGARGALSEAPVDGRLWQRCGVAIMSLYLAVCAATGGVYRPRGAAWGTPAFYVFPLMLLVVIATFVVDRSRSRSDAP
ncbi:MAG: hypothetical protein KF795_10195 [Labilithrix sp.]|nr:hypothetical protein [Labilithrix sp.]